jgi:hypothetical protein
LDEALIALRAGGGLSSLEFKNKPKINRKQAENKPKASRKQAESKRPHP